ncbi:NADH-dependent [FeFe] hydrogenase, group A6 [Pseudothermotoga thermarum]|uniref:Hydrogenase, Fe-only n=1 Tax=Pseudothermotoga thermarum DSM 5069 TaxID=688269 RepID=F7YWR9_9THEM|nr:NADH-dependent [FeFe] hydrogenase, group A6 [Pseudothermotoga thermarum]AEH50198.1 hydrogenase, Fe-only [Pseudothermotoga thermarum DSM 5069]
MTVKVFINGKQYEVPANSTVLEACNLAGVYVPTLCNHPRLEPTGACRVCVVEVEGSRNLQPACATKVADGMRIITRSERVERAVKFNLSLLLSRHPKDCMTCEVNGRCEFQDLIYRYNIKDIFGGEQPLSKVYDDSSPAIIRDLEKCIVCGRCVRACSELQGMDIYSMVDRGFESLPQTAFEMPVYDTDCIACGQCSVFCPVGAITENSQVRKVLEELEKHDKVLIVQTAPATRVALGEEFGLEPGSISTGKMVAALRRLGFDYVFDTNFAADLTIMEEGSEFLERLKNGGPFPMFTSCCPAWINMMEKLYPQFIPNVSSAKSPHQMLGAVVKTYFAKKINVDPKNIFLVSIMPCTAKKDDIIRPQHMINGVPAVDVVLTTRELAKLIKIKKIPFATLPDENYDDPLGESTGAGAIFGVTGGVMEAALRTAYELGLGKPLGKIEFESVRGLEGIKEATIDFNGKKLKVAVAHGGLNVRRLLDKIVAGEVYYDFVEIMACSGGCIGGGGQPKSLDKDVLVKRMKAIYTIDELSVIRKSHENPSIKKLYQEFLEHPLSHVAHETLHTTYMDRSKKKGKVEVLEHV